MPITPVVSVGAHETLFVLARGNELAKKLGLTRIRVDVLPFWLGLPFGIGWGPIPNLPLPSKIKLEVLRADPLVEGARQRPTPTTSRSCATASTSSASRMQIVADRCTPSARYPASRLTSASQIQREIGRSRGQRETTNQ